MSSSGLLVTRLLLLLRLRSRETRVVMLALAGWSILLTAAIAEATANDPPTATNLSAAETFVEDTSRNLADIVVGDVDSAALTVTLTLSDSAAGGLTTASSGAVTSVYDAGTGVWSAAGAIADVNTLLAGVSFVPAPNFNGNFTIATSVSDGVAAPLTGSKAVTGVAVNDAPVLDAAGSPVLASVFEDAGAPSGAVGTLVSDLVDFVSPSGGLDNVSDVDAGAMLGIAVVGVDSTNFSCFYSLNGGVIWSPFGGVSTTSAQLLAAVPGNRVYCRPAANAAGSFSSVLTFRAWDRTSGSDGTVASTATSGGASAFSTATDGIELTVTPINDAPTATNLSAAETYVEDTSRNLADIVVGDVDSAALTVTLTLSDSAAGGLTTASSGAVTSVYDAGTGVWSAAGAIADVNTLLAGVSFVPAPNFNGNFTIATAVSDGNSVVTGRKSVTREVTLATSVPSVPGGTDGGDAPAPPTPPAPSGESIASLERHSPVSGYSGHLAWSDYDAESGRYVLMTREGAEIRRAPVPSRSVPFDVDLGPDAQGRPMAVYSRCRREAEPRSSLEVGDVQSAGGDCSLFAHRLGSRREQRLRGLSRGRGSEYRPTIWKSQIAFVRRRSGRERLHLARLGGGQERLRAVRSDQVITKIDLRGRRVAFSVTYEEGGAARCKGVNPDDLRSPQISEIWIRLSDAQKRVDRGCDHGAVAAVAHPSLDGRWLVYERATRENVRSVTVIRALDLRSSEHSDRRLEDANAWLRGLVSDRGRLTGLLPVVRNDRLEYDLITVAPG